MSRSSRIRRRLVVPAALVALLLPGGRAAAQQGQAEEPSFEQALVDLLRERGLIDEAQGEELLRLARERAHRDTAEMELIEGNLARLRAPEVEVHGGKPGDLEFRSADGKWSLGIKGRLQARAEDFHSENDTLSGVNFSVPRARLTFAGKAGSENVRYKLQIDGSTNTQMEDPPKDKNVELKDAWIDWRFPWGTGLRMGQFRFPFGREGLPDGGLSLTSLSIATNEFVPSREPGSELHDKFAHDTWEVYTAVANGEGLGKNNDPGQERNGLRSGVRVVWNPLGKVDPSGPAFQTVDDGSVRLGLGASYMDNKDSSGLNTPTPGADTRTSGLEAQLFAGPVSFLAEAFNRTSDRAVGPHVDDTGNVVQLGCFIVPDRWELVARYSDIDFAQQDDQFERAVDLNYYVDRNNAKWQLEYRTLDSGGNPPDSRRLRLQFQVMF